MRDDNDYVEFDRFPSEIAAAAAAARLGAAGIDAVMEPVNPRSEASVTRIPRPSRLLVSRHDLARAREAVGAVSRADGYQARATSESAAATQDAITTGLLEIRRRRRIMWFFFLTCPAAIALALALWPEAAPYVAGCCLAGLLAISGWADNARCPACGNIYYRRRYVRNPWTDQCLHCRLSLRVGRNR